MTYAKVKTLCLPNLWEAETVTVEASVQRGLPRFQITGLTGARDRVDRVRQALRSSGRPLPYSTLLVHLAPVDLPKKGGYFDLSIAAGLLIALEGAPPGSLLAEAEAEDTVFLGELSLSGALRPLGRALPFLRGARSLGIRRVVLPTANWTEAGLVPDLHCIAVDHLRDLLAGPRALAAPEIVRPENISGNKTENISGNLSGNNRQNRSRQRDRPRLVGKRPDLDHRGLQLTSKLKRAISTAAAGRHSLLLIGPPGSGKTSLARLLPALAPPPDQDECLDILTITEAIHPRGQFEVHRPLRQPHHSVTDIALVGGGRPLAPGEITRAHHGVLLLDELAEFSRSALQSLREPMEQAQIHLSRVGERAIFPARFQLAATTNPCPCGFRAFADCNCSEAEKQRYLSRLLGPLRDRIDIEFIVDETGEREAVSADWAEELETARALQAQRYAGTSYRFNADVSPGDLDSYCSVEHLRDDPAYADVRHRVGSFRRWDRIRRLSRTVADLDGAAEIRPSDLLEAFSYRCLDEIWKENP